MWENSSHPHEGVAMQFTCPHGHHWKVDVSGALSPSLREKAGAATVLQAACPVCGAAGQPDSASATGQPDTITTAEASTQDFVPANPNETIAYIRDKSEGPLPQLPGYQIRGVLGRGGMGVVYKAFQLSLKRDVALKMILAKGHAGPHELQRFRTEAEAVAQLQHPNIVQIHDIGEQDGLPYFSLEFVDGPSLAQKIDGNALPVPEAAALATALARAMHYSHQRGIVHRDLKPSNVLLQTS